MKHILVLVTLVAVALGIRVNYNGIRQNPYQQNSLITHLQQHHRNIQSEQDNEESAAENHYAHRINHNSQQQYHQEVQPTYHSEQIPQNYNEEYQSRPGYNEEQEDQSEYRNGEEEDNSKSQYYDHQYEDSRQHYHNEFPPNDYGYSNGKQDYQLGYQNQQQDYQHYGFEPPNEFYQTIAPAHHHYKHKEVMHQAPKKPEVKKPIDHHPKKQEHKKIKQSDETYKFEVEPEYHYPMMKHMEHKVQKQHHKEHKKHPVKPVYEQMEVVPVLHKKPQVKQTVHKKKEEKKIKKEEKHHDHHEEHYIDYTGHPKYHFDYFVHDPKSHDLKNQWEIRDGDNVKGEYSFLQPDGKIRVVEYESKGKEGMNYNVKYMKLEKSEKNNKAER